MIVIMGVLVLEYGHLIKTTMRKVQQIMTLSPDERSLLVEVARLYYEQQLTQSEIGRRINTSRSTVSRLLQEARDSGIVTITIDYDVVRDNGLETQLKETFGLQAARVLRSYDRSHNFVRKGIGQLAARVLEANIEAQSILGISYGRSIADTVAQIHPMDTTDVTVVPIIGALGSENPLIEGIDLTRELAMKLKAKYRYLYAPLLVEDSRTRQLFLQEPTVQDVLKIGAQSKTVIIGIGALQAEASGIIFNGYINRKERDWLQNIGVVGHMCAQFFDIDGHPLDISPNKRSISIGLEALRSIENVIAVAGTVEKAKAIFGALNGNYIDTLVTDDRAAETILALRDGDAQHSKDDASSH